MENKQTKASQIYLVIVAIVGWFALILQFYLMIQNRKVSIPETTIRFFSFYTILTNILIALYSTFLLLKPDSGWGKYFSRPSVATAITIYILVVGITYNLILRQIWNPQGWDKVADELLHLAIPILFLVYWLIFVPKGTLKSGTVFPWLIYPLVYFIWTMIFGTLSGFYPYFFIDVNELGFGKVLLNSGVLTSGFLLLSLLFVGLDRLPFYRVK